MAWTSTDLDNIEEALASGLLTVEIQGRRVTYQSTAALLQVRALIRSSLAGTVGQATSGWPAGRRLARFASGLASSDSGCGVDELGERWNRW